MPAVNESRVRVLKGRCGFISRKFHKILFCAYLNESFQGFILILEFLESAAQNSRYP